MTEETSTPQTSEEMPKIDADITVINVKPSPKSIDKSMVACPLCLSDIYKKNMSNSCPKGIEGHNVCTSCEINLKKQYFNGKSGCIYCGDRNTTERETVINISTPPIPEPPAVVVFVNDVQNSFIKWLKDMAVGMAITFAMAICYIACCCIFHIIRILASILEGDDNFDTTDISFAIGHGVLGFITVFCCGVVAANMRQTSQVNIR